MGGVGKAALWVVSVVARERRPTRSRWRQWGPYIRPSRSRTAADVIDEVMRKEARQRRPSPQNKRVCAELLVGKVALFLWLAQEVIRRNPRGTKLVIFLSDGERALHDRQSEYLPENTICILDLFHVLERLWKAAWCFFEEGTQKRECISGWKIASSGSWRGKWIR